MAVGTTPEIYTQSIVLLTGAVVAAPLFSRLGLGTVLGYLAAGVILGPVAGIVQNGTDILHFAELGVVFLLFIVGLEMKPSRLWSMRKDILGLGSVQVMLCGIVLSLIAYLVIGRVPVALIAGFGLALSSTAYVLQMLKSHHETNTPHGRKAFSVLLFQDIAIIPMLAVLPLLSYSDSQAAHWSAFLVALGAISFVVLVGNYLLNPILRAISNAGAQEVMIAAALLLVFGTAMLMQSAGLSMALGSFLAGVLLAESSFKIELEANIEPFRGILLGLFFIAVGLSLQVEVLLSDWPAIVAFVVLAMVVKSVIIYIAVRLFGDTNATAIRTAAILSQHGEFGFVLFTSAASIFVLSTRDTSFLISIVVLSMVLTPLADWLGRKLVELTEPDDHIEEDFEGAEGSPVLIIGFSRMGQVVSQAMLAAGIEVTVIDNNPNVIRQASKFGFKIFFGNGERKDVLQSAGIADCQMVCICTHLPEVTNRTIDLIAGEFPEIPIYVRAYDRAHTLQLMDKPVKFHTRETFESALMLGNQMLQGLGKSPDDANVVIDDVRRRDEARLLVQYHEGLYAGQDHLHTAPVIQPEPLIEPAHEAEALDERSREFIEEAKREDA